MKIWFFWTWDFSLNILKWLKNLWLDICLIVSQPDKPVWRKLELVETPVKKYWIENNIKVYQPVKLRENKEFFSLLTSYDLDFIVVVAYGKIIPKELLSIPKYGCINLHGSILPKYRWASPIQESIKNGDIETWLTVMYMSEWMDEWDILKIAKINIDNIDKTQDIFNKFSNIGPNLLKETLEKVITWEIKGIPQNNNEATYCKKIEKEDGKIDFHTMTTKQIYDLWRAYSIWPWIYTHYEWKKLEIDNCYLDESIDTNLSKGSVFFTKKNIWIVCSDNKILFIKQVKLEWKKSMDILSFVNGNKTFKEYIF